MMKQYQTDAQRTVSNSFHSHNVPAPALYAILYRALKESRHVDVAKKSLFYGREPSGSTADLIAGAAPIPVGYDPEQLHVLHAILGIYTEAVELVELLMKSLASGEPIKAEDLINETGDVQWYQALMYEAIGVTFEQVGAGNITKLKTRYPDKFKDGAKDEAKEIFEMMKTISTSSDSVPE